MTPDSVTTLSDAFMYLFINRPELIWFLAAIFAIEFIVVSKLNHLSWTRVLGNWAMISLIMGTFQIGRWMIVGDLMVTLPQGLMFSAWLIMFTANLMVGVLATKLLMDGSRASRAACYRWLAGRTAELCAHSLQKAILLEQKTTPAKEIVAARKAEALEKARKIASDAGHASH